MKTGTVGVLLGFLGYGLFTISDAAVKAIGTALDIFEIGFLTMLVASPVMLASKPAAETWRSTFHVRQPLLVALRAFLGMFSGVCVVIAFTTIPFAEVFALLFLAPTIAALLSRVFLREPLEPRTMCAIALGLVGVLVAIRPGLRELATGHLAAFAAAFSVGASLTLLRQLSRTERRTTILGALALVTLVVNGIAMIPAFRWPDTTQWLLILLAGVVDGMGQIAILLATRRAAASNVAATHYSQLIWAVLIGAIVFAERPDRWMFVGLGAIAASGAITLLATRREPSNTDSRAG